MGEGGKAEHLEAEGRGCSDFFFVVVADVASNEVRARWTSSKCSLGALNMQPLCQR